MEEIKEMTNRLQWDLKATQRLIDKAVDSGEEATITMDYKAFLTYFNRYWLEDFIADWFYEQVKCKDYDVEVRFENDIVYVTISLSIL